MVETFLQLGCASPLSCWTPRTKPASQFIMSEREREGGERAMPSTPLAAFTSFPENQINAVTHVNPSLLQLCTCVIFVGHACVYISFSLILVSLLVFGKWNQVTASLQVTVEALLLQRFSWRIYFPSCLKFLFASVSPQTPFFSLKMYFWPFICAHLSTIPPSIYWKVYVLFWDETQSVWSLLTQTIPHRPN